MENIDFAFTAFGKLEHAQLVLLLLAALSWFGGGHYLREKHKTRLKCEDIEYNDNLRLELINCKEWAILALHLAFTFGLLISAIVVGNSS